MPLPGVGIILENPAAAPIPTAVAWGATNIGLSTFAGTSPFYDQPPYGTAVDVPDCYFQIPNVRAAIGAAMYVIPPGMGYYVAGTITGTCTLQLQVGALTTWVTVATLTTASSGFYVSDGINVRINSGTTCAITFYPIRA